MNPKRILFVGVTVGIVTAAIGVAWQAQRRAGAAEAAWAALARERAAILAKQRTVPAAMKNGESALAQPDDGETKAIILTETVSTPVALRRLRQDPELQELGLAAWQARTAVDYAPLFRTLGLSPEQRATFLENLRRKREQALDLESAWVGLPEGSGDAVETTRKQIEQDYDSVQRALLGDAGFEKARDFEHSTLVRDEVKGLAAQAMLANMPLTLAQAEELVGLLVANARQRSKSKSDGWVDIGAIDWNEADTAAKGILSAAQLELFKSSDAGSGRFSTALDRAFDAAHAENPPALLRRWISGSTRITENAANR